MGVEITGAVVETTVTVTPTVETFYGGGGGGEMQTKSVSYTPSETAISDAVTPDEGYDGLSKVNVTVDAVSPYYIGSEIDRRSSSDMVVSGKTVRVPAGYYSVLAAKSVADGTEGTPTATKGAVSNHSVSVTPSVTNSAGYIAGGTKTGTPVTVSASELVSGDKSITANGNNIDVTDYATVSVNVSGGGGGATTIASGTWTSSGQGSFEISVGDDCPINNFAFFLWLDETENPVFAYNSTYKMGYFSYVHDSELGPYVAGSTTASYQNYDAASWSFVVDNSGTQTTYTRAAPSGQIVIRNNTTAQGSYNAPTIRKYSDSVKVYWSRANSSYVFPSGLKFKYRLIYFGSNYANESISI